MNTTKQHKLISAEDQKLIQLEMLKELDKFCREKSIRYSLAFGTLLGAIRHKGFIPWDDDVDIMMPLPDFERFKRDFVSDSIIYCDVDTQPYFEFDFSRVAYDRTFQIRGIRLRSYGVNIDLYPIVSIPDDFDAQSSFFQKAEQLDNCRKSILKWGLRLVRILPLKRIPGLTRVVRRLRNYMFYSFNYASSGTYYIISGPLSLRYQTIFTYDLFEDCIDVEFEGQQFQAISKYDEFLRHRYGNYMELPPIDQRHPYHGGVYYWK